MIIREERESDHKAISDVTEAAFKNHPYGSGTEQFIVKALREGGSLSVSLVAELEGSVVGHIAFSPVKFSDGNEGWYGLGPVSVEPGYQGLGIGTELVNSGLKILKDKGAGGCVLVGEPSFYKRFGFASPEGLRHEGVPQENFLALSFCGIFPSGDVKFHSGFGATE